MTAADVVRAYHERSKHRPERYASGPETLDWDAQPDPYRRFSGSLLEPLPLPADSLALLGHPTWSDLFEPAAVDPRPMNRTSVGLLFELSLALSAWKEHGPDRWAVRCNPSSGNLHPTEAYLLAHGVKGLGDGLYHYTPREHALEHRATGSLGLSQEQPRLYLGLSSIQWREAWKYGERAFRYCQLDAGHALGAVRYAAAVLGWKARVVEGLDHSSLARLLGLDRVGDFEGVEAEEAELLIELDAGSGLSDRSHPAWQPGAAWAGRANRLDRHPMYRWPVIDEVAAATRGSSGRALRHDSSTSVLGDVTADVAPPPRRDIAAPTAEQPAVNLIRQRRSAQRFDPRAIMPAASLARLMAALSSQGLPWDARPGAPRIHLLLFIHRAEGVAAGAYLLPRSAAGEAAMRQSLDPSLHWERVDEWSATAYKIAENRALAGTLRTLNCHQALGSDAMLGVSMLAEFDGPLDSDPSAYRKMLQEAGLVGQMLYMEAEAAGLRGTGIGCFFDDALHALVGLRGNGLQAIYHFTIGAAVVDPRIATCAPYPERSEARST